MVLYLLVLVLIFLFFLLPAYLLFRREEAESRRQLELARASGRNEPISIRPWIDAEKCMGSGTCTRVCPEGEVLKVIDGRAVVVDAATCVGHGACEAACPVDAIELVFGSARRGVDIPAVKPTFESNVPGLYIAGELGGMGLIANAVEQGRQAVQHLAATSPVAPADGVQLIIVGAGPAGVSAALHAEREGLEARLIDQEGLGGAILHYPRRKVITSRGFELPGAPRVPPGTITKEELVQLFHHAAGGLDLREHERVTALSADEAGLFTVQTDKGRHRAARVMLCIGRRGTPRRLGVEGEGLPKVTYALIDPAQFQFQHVLVVGGGDSAVEAACSLAEEQGCEVTLSYRRERINRPRAKNRKRIEEAGAAGEVRLELGTVVERIGLDRVVLRRGEEEIVLPNDHVFVFIGGTLPTGLLQAAGIDIERHHGKRVERIPSTPQASE